MRSIATRTAGAVVLLAMLIVPGIGALLAQDAATDSTPPEVSVGAPISDDSTAQTDSAIRQRLEQLFTAVQNLREVRARVEGGVAILSGHVSSNALRTSAAELAQRVEGVAVVENEIVVEADLAWEPIWERLQVRLRAAIAFLPLLAIGATVFVLFWFGSGLVVRTARPLLGRTRNAFVEDLTAKTLRLAVVLAGALIALDVMEATAVLGSVLGAAGLVGLAVGFALRDTIENYMASVLLSLRQPFAPNDLVMIDGIEGVVVRLTSRATVLMTLDGNHVRVPNAAVFKATLTNFTRNPERRFEFTVGVGTGCDLPEAREVALAALDKLDAVLKEPKPLLLVHELADWSVVLWVAAWVDQRRNDFLKTRSEAIRLVKTAFDDAGIEMPAPTSTVRTVPAEIPAQPAAKARPAVAKPAQADTAKDDAIGRKAAEDRSDATAPNLLNPRAPQE